MSEDVVAELGRWLDDNATAITITSWAMIKRARDEIVALRAKHVEVVEFDLVRHARDEALEEAARHCERVPGDPKHGDFFAAAIRALKGEGDG